MGSKFRFNPETGTMEPVGEEVASKQDEPSKPNNKTQIIGNPKKPEKEVEAEEGVVHFRERSDFSMFQILDEDTKAVMGYIAGYGLDISFNLQELRGVERIEQFLEAVKGLFRQIITDQILNQNN